MLTRLYSPKDAKGVRPEPRDETVERPRILTRLKRTLSSKDNLFDLWRNNKPESPVDVYEPRSPDGSSACPLPLVTLASLPPPHVDGAAEVFKVPAPLSATWVLASPPRSPSMAGMDMAQRVATLLPSPPMTPLLPPRIEYTPGVPLPLLQARTEDSLWMPLMPQRTEDPLWLPLLPLRQEISPPSPSPAPRREDLPPSPLLPPRIEYTPRVDFRPPSPLSISAAAPVLEGVSCVLSAAQETHLEATMPTLPPSYLHVLREEVEDARSELQSRGTTESERDPFYLDRYRSAVNTPVSSDEPEAAANAILEAAPVATLLRQSRSRAQTL